MVKPTTIQIILTLALSQHSVIHQLDVNNAFLNGILHEEAYITQPEGFSEGSNLVCKLHKALYGLKQAPRAWFERLEAALIKFGFTRSKCNPSFIHTHGTSSTYVLVYIDEIIIMGASASVIQELIMKLQSELALKDLGPLHYFLGLKVHHLANGSLLLSQQKYIRDPLLKSKMDKAKAISTPMISRLKLSKHGSDKFDNPSLYRLWWVPYNMLQSQDLRFLTL